MIDSHAHLDSPRYDEDRMALLERASAAGVHDILSIGIGDGPDTMQRALEIAASMPGVPISRKCGPAPESIPTKPASPTKPLCKLTAFSSNRKCWPVARLDSTTSTTTPRATAEDRLRPPMEIAAAHKKPIIIHCRPSDNSSNAWDDTLSVLRTEWSGTGLGGILHCFTGELRHATEAMDLGFLISFAGNITFPKAQPIRDVAAVVPLDRMLIETDAPFLAPIPNRGKRNEPAWVSEVASKIAEVRGIDPAEVATRTTTNFSQFFRTEIPPPAHLPGR